MHFSIDVCIDFMYNKSKLREQRKGEKKMKEAIKKLESKGYYIDNQFDGWFGTFPDRFELHKGDEIVMDNLSESQVISLAEIL